MMSDNHKYPEKQTLITTHANADFDALSSLLAAQKLYPDALVVFPGTQDKNIRNFFIKSMAYLFNWTDIQDIDPKKVTRLVLVDTKQTHRVEHVSEILSEPDLDIHIYDHHPESPADIKGTLDISDMTGANITILVERIRRKRIALSPDEATVMCLGLYEDTGGFTYTSTTERDFSAAAFLLGQGANLSLVSDLLARDMTTEQVALLNDMVQSATHYHIHGFDIVLASIVREDYIPDVAFLVQKMTRMKNPDALFAMAMMENKIHIVARSRTEDVDVGKVLAEFGGGGHGYAASATVRNETLPQVEHRLVDIIYRNIESERLARHLMSTPAITISEIAHIKTAKQRLTRYNINALTVTRRKAGGRRPMGFITRQIVEKALYHGLGKVRVKEFMRTDIAVVSPDATLDEIQEKIIDHRQRILPVVDNKNLVGVITRTDLLKTLVEDNRRLHRPSVDQIRPKTRNVVNFMKERLSDRVFAVLRDIGKTADGLNESAFVVGGFVRDLFLYRHTEDMDIVIEGDGIRFAKTHGAEIGARVHIHEKFGTAVMTFPDGFKVDVASARTEYYRYPADLPMVEMSSIKLDLFRRDFTINTLMIKLNETGFGTLVDFFSARRDIKERAIRILHNLSFVEDPTRVFRAIRFEQRFGFRIGKPTARLIENAVKMDFFKRLDGHRLRNELRLILREENPIPAIKRLHDFNLIRVIHSGIKFNSELIETLEAVKKAIAWYDLLFLEDSYTRWAVYFMGLIRELSPGQTRKACDRLQIPPDLAPLFCDKPQQAEKIILTLSRGKKHSNSRVYELLSGERIEVILYMMAVSHTEKIRRYISGFVTKLRNAKALVTGGDIKKFDIPPGPVYKEILAETLKARLDGKVKTKNDELAFIKTYIQSTRKTT